MLFFSYRYILMALNAHILMIINNRFGGMFAVTLPQFFLSAQRKLRCWFCSAIRSLECSVWFLSLVWLHFGLNRLAEYHFNTSSAQQFNSIYDKNQWMLCAFLFSTPKLLNSVREIATFNASLGNLNKQNMA